MSIDKREHFPLSLDGEFVGKGSWKLTNEFKYICNNGYIVTAPIGFISDGASIPKIFYAIVGSPWTGKYVEGAVIHDFLYSKAERPRKECDDIFLEAMTVLKVPKWKRTLMYRAVRMFGGFCGYNTLEKDKKPI